MRNLEQIRRVALGLVLVCALPWLVGAARAEMHLNLADITLERLEGLHADVRAQRSALAAVRAKAVDARLAKDVARALQADTDDVFEPEARAAARGLRVACAAEDRDACLALAAFYEDGQGTWPDENLAFAFYVTGCHARHADSCAKVMWHWRINAVSGRYEGRAPFAEVVTGACAEGHGAMCRHQSLAQRYGRQGLPLDEALAAQLLHRACDLGDETACARLPKPPEAVFQANEALCAQGNSFGCYLKGVRLISGEGTVPDPEAGAALVQQSCGKGVAQACGWLVKTHDLGPAEAARLFEQACLAVPGRICNTAIRRLKRTPDTEARAARLAILRETACSTDNARCLRTIWEQMAHAAAAQDPLQSTPPHLVSQALEQDRLACAAEEGAACRRLALAYAGSGQRVDRLFAGAILHPLCEGGAADICLDMVDILPAPLEDQVALYAQACAHGASEGCLLEVLHDPQRADADRLAPLQAACSAGDTKGCRMQGTLLIEKAGLYESKSADRARGQALLAFACDSGDGLACYVLGQRLLVQARRVSGQSETRALAYLETGCEAGVAGACRALGGYYEFDVPRSPAALQTALGHYEALCQASLRRECNPARRMQRAEMRAGLRAEYGALRSALMAHEADFKPLYQARVRRYRRDCAAGDMAQCVSLGDRYVDALEVDGIYGLKDSTPADWDWANALYAHACAAGEPAGCGRLAKSYRNEGFSAEKQMYHSHLQRACDVGDAGSCYQLATLYQEGEGVAKDLAAAEAYLRRACDLGAGFACESLGSYAMQDGPAATRVDRMLRACLYGNANACETLIDGLSEMRRTGTDDVVRRLADIGCDHGKAAMCQRAGRPEGQ